MTMHFPGDTFIILPEDSVSKSRDPQSAVSAPYTSGQETNPGPLESNQHLLLSYLQSGDPQKRSS